MEKQYLDLYSLFRHNPAAENYFENLPDSVQEQIRTRRQLINSLSDLQGFNNNIQNGGF